MRETHEIVVNWDDGQNVQVELTTLVALHAQTREYTLDELFMLADEQAASPRRPVVCTSHTIRRR